MSQPLPIGIDLGTTNSVIATARGDEFDVLPNALGDRTTPSVVSYDWETDDVYVGTPALNRAVSHPSDTIQSIKRHMGSDETFALGPDTHRPEAISALVLKKLVRDATEALQRPVSEAVITVPAYFTERERKATKKAGEIAGLTVERIITEPTAACLAYGLGAGTAETVFVYDLGGGTFDCSVVEISDGMVDVRGVDGNTDLGGDDYDGLLVDWLRETIAEAHGSRPALDDPEIESRLFDAAKAAKHDLSARESTTVSLPFLELEDGETVTVEQTLTRATFDRLANGPTEETLSISRQLLDELSLSPAGVDRVLLVGGSTRMPVVQAAVTDLFGQSPERGLNPDQVVALGAVAQACIVQDRELPSASSTTVLPVTAATDDSGVVDDGTQPVLLDVLPQTVGVKLVDGRTREPYFQPIVPKGESLPARAMTQTQPIEDQQTHSTFEIYQGNTGSLTGNQKLDEFQIGPYPPKNREEQSHRVEIAIDENGIIHAQAIDENHGVRDGITVEAQFELTGGEMDRMERDLPTLHE